MTTLTKYISREFIKFFLLCQFILFSLFLVIDFVQKIDNFIERSVSKGSVFLYFFYKTPYVILQMIPVSSMISIIFLICIMKKNNEILAIRNGGLNIVRSLSPIFALTLLLSIVTFLFSELIVPYSSSRFNEIWDIEVERQDPARFYGREQIWYRSKSAIYWIKHFDINKNIMDSPTFYLFDSDFKVQKKISGKMAIWDKGIWKIEEAVIQTLENDNNYHTEKSEIYTLEIPEKPENFATRVKNPEDMSYQQLKRYTEKIKDEGYDNSIYLVDLYMKITFPLISAVLALIAVPLSLMIKRGGTPMAITAGIVICFLYLSIMSFSKSLGLSGTLPPVLSAWTANLIFSFFGIYLLICVKK